jgi:hypothetical protein
MTTRHNQRAQRLSIFLACSILITAVSACDKPKSNAASPNGDKSAASEINAAEGKLGGLYIRQRSVSMFFGGRMTFSLARDFFYFFPDGHVLFGVPTEGELKEHPSAADYAAFKDVAPELRGTYAVKDGKITFHPEKGNESTEPFSIPKPGDDSVLQIGDPSIVGSVKAVPFKDDQKLDGTYVYDGTIGLRAVITVFNLNTLTFRPDGSLASDQLTGVDTVGVNTGAGNSGVTTHSQTASAGAYKLKEFTLQTTIGPKTEKQTAFLWAGDTKAAEPGIICIAGRVYMRKQPQK